MIIIVLAQWVQTHSFKYYACLVSYMDGATHSRWFFRSLVFFIPFLVYTQRWWFIPLLILSNSIVDSDEDNKWNHGGPHRHFITHSIIWPLLIATAFWLPAKDITGMTFMPYFFVMCAPVVIHLFLDLYTPVRGDDNKTHWHYLDAPKGKYRIRIKKGFRLSVEWTRAWLIGNIIAGLALMVVGFTYFYA